ncbi:MAG: transcription termination/antitermination protein NusA [Deltaproteobacteria bacterium]|nr:transcription termination/antitermination protein NusA [Deltaproteobacteria bacterium]
MASSETYDLNMIIEQVTRDKGIDREILISALENAIQTAAKKTFGMTRELEAQFNEETGGIDLFQFMFVTDGVSDPECEVDIKSVEEAGLDAEVGDALGFQLFYREGDEEKAAEQDKIYGPILNVQTFDRRFGRIAAQIAKQVITQRLRDAERDLVYNDYKDRKFESVTGIVRRFERGNNVIVDLGRAEAVLPGREQLPRESFRVGDRIQAFIKDIDREARGLQIILSRADIGFLKKLFEQEVPEIAEGIVRIVNAVREPGSRAKVAVASRDVDVDPVGACVGMKGSRVQAIVQELRGEKIDIVPWDRDSARYVCNAISPAEVSKVIIDDPNGTMELIVPDEKLSLAIGRKGQNVRLAASLTGWHLDIISETVFKKMEEETILFFCGINEVDETLARTMYKLGFRSIEDVIDAEPQELAAIPGLGGQEVAGAIQAKAREMIEDERRQRILDASRRTEPLTERERMLFVSGIGERTIELLLLQGYETVEQISEEDVDRFAIRTGLGLKKARSIIQGARQFLESEKAILDEATQIATEAGAEPPPTAAVTSKTDESPSGAAGGDEDDDGWGEIESSMEGAGDDHKE